MKLTSRLCALAVAFGLFSGATIAAAAFLPLEQYGRDGAALRPAHSFHLNRVV
ncbi:MAG TPA: hypothetical protein VKS78_13430 [Roseiarcus sp.]|nr:hypothetical protein [Roseiarcus sp.]